MVAAALLERLDGLAQRFASAGRRLYLVGGVVRDQLLARPLEPGSDLDLTTDAPPEEIKALVTPVASALWTQGERFGTIGCIIDGQPMEITTHRGEAYLPRSRKPEVVYATAIEEDLSRRDFTVNAMAVSLPGGELIDPFGGLEDLRRARLRTPRSPWVSFSDDPLRMLRAARFVAAHDLAPDAELIRAITEMAPRLEIVSVERRRDELDKLLRAPRAAAGLDLLVDTALVTHLLDGFAPRSRAVWDGVRQRVDALAPELALRRTALLHVPGTDPGVAVDLARRLRLSNAEVGQVGVLARAWQQVFDHHGPWAPEDLRRLAAAAGDQLSGVVALAATTGDVTELADQLAALQETEDLSGASLPVDGDDVMQVLGVGPGPVVGEAIRWLWEQRLRDGPLSHDEAVRRLRAWWADRSEAFLASPQDQRGGNPTA